MATGGEGAGGADSEAAASDEVQRAAIAMGEALADECQHVS